MSEKEARIFTHAQSAVITLPEILKIPTIRVNIRRKPLV